MEVRSNGHGQVVGSGVGGLALGLMIGAIAGGIAVMMYAPKSGPETRSQLREEINETQRMFQNWANDLNERVNRFTQIFNFRGARDQISNRM